MTSRLPQLVWQCSLRSYSGFHLVAPYARPHLNLSSNEQLPRINHPLPTRPPLSCWKASEVGNIGPAQDEEQMPLRESSLDGEQQADGKHTKNKHILFMFFFVGFFFFFEGLVHPRQSLNSLHSQS